MSHWCVNSMARIIMLLPLMLTCLGIPAWAANPVAVSKDSAFMKQYRRAMKLAKQEDWDEAVDAFKAAYEAQPTERPEIHLYIARAYVKLEQGSDALKYYSRFLREAKNMTPSQRIEMESGMREAQALIEEGIRRRERRTREAGREESLALASVSSRTSLPGSRVSPLRPLPEEPSESSPQRGEKTATDPPRSTTPTYKVELSGRKPQTPYLVHVSTGAEEANSVCTTPCSMRALAGPARMTVTGPGSKQFEQEVMLPAGPSRVRVQHFTLSRTIAGPILIALSAPFVAGGTLLLTDSRSLSSGAIFGATPLLLHGVVFFFTGLGQLASIKRNHIDIQSIGGTPPGGGSMATRATEPALQLANVSLSPATDRKGITTAVTFRF